jgi:hypothetical protein
MKTRPIIVLLGCTLLFTMCKKDKDVTSTPPNNGGGGTDTTHINNPDRPQIVSITPLSGDIGDTISIACYLPGPAASPRTVDVKFGSISTPVISTSVTIGPNNTGVPVFLVVVPQMTDTVVNISVQWQDTTMIWSKLFTRTSLAKFTDFSPANAYIGDTITLKGTFSTISKPTVSFGNVSATVTSYTTTTIKAVVPDKIAAVANTISVTTVGTTVSSANTFTLNAAVITSNAPLKAFPGDGITINGKGFGRTNQTYQVYVDGTAVSAILSSTTQFSITLSSAGKHGIVVNTAGLQTATTDSVEIVVPSITALSATSVTNGDNLVITGVNFKESDGEPSIVTLTDSNGKTYSILVNPVSDTELDVTIPLLSAGQYKVGVTVRNSSDTFGTSITYVDDGLGGKVHH